MAIVFIGIFWPNLEMSVHSLESPYITYEVRRVVVMHVVGVLAVVGRPI